MNLLFFFKKILSYIVFLPLAFASKFLLVFSNFLLLIASYLVYFKSGNIFFKNFKTDLIIKKKISFKNFEISAKINNYWDFWRSKNFETYPISIILKDLENYKIQNKKIVYYEIGANVGYSSIIIAKILKNFGEVITFEVDPTNFKSFNDNIILNNIKNLISFNFGISSKNKLTKFYQNIQHSNNKYNLPSSSMGMHSVKFNKEIHKENVYNISPMLKFQDVIELFNLPNPTHLFIDAYGAEREIIDSLIGSDKKIYPDMIMVDIEEKIISLEESQIKKILEKNHYKLINYNLERGENNIPDSYKTVFKKI